MAVRKPYDTDLSDEEWRILRPLVPEAKPGGRPRTHEARELLDAVFYMVRGGCAWRLLPHEFPPWKTVYHYFRLWRLDGTWGRIHAALRERLRRRSGREATPSAAIIDSQTARTTEKGGPQRRPPWLRRREEDQRKEAASARGHHRLGGRGRRP